ncbi:FxsA family protein [Palleronia caenipelagi]|uniref:FxsA family protein n=1 Tax=Palleronia caenipelagi TaxID=2489174 RepID=A0A547Q8U2_9RHOB|nr:FxsA family protein [Palleronia caenipelagi]TRD22792.1 FxsA family protein [Palleronia caenipelagi]
MWLFAAFIAVPLIEIALFIQIGGLIGLWPTLLIVVVTAILGTSLVRSQGALAMGQIRGALNDLSDPSEPMAHGAMILFAGALLLTPGFFTDACGFALLIPGVRSALFRKVRERVTVSAGFTYGRTGPDTRPRPDPTIIEGEYKDVDITPPDPNRQPSGWTRRTGDDSSNASD